jgi:iron complex outermembrane receptor protein
MKNLRSRMVIATASLAAIAVLKTAGTAFGQSPAAPAPAETQTLEKFVVTGSYLPTASLVSSSPVTIIDSTAVEASGDTNILMALKRLDTGFAGNSSYGTEDNNGSQGLSASGAGESYVALRNLTTLVLLDGRRIAASAFSGDNVDLNTIPIGMIDRIEVLKDGASTVYGSDAIGGVINIITKKNYNGAELYAGYGATTDGRDYNTHNYGIVGGASNDNTSIVFNADVSYSSPLLTTQRAIAHLSLAQVAAAGGAPGSTADAYYSGSFPGRVNSDVLAGSPLLAGGVGYNAAIQTPVVWSSPAAIKVQTLTQLEAQGIYVPGSNSPLYAQASNSIAFFNTATFNNDSIIQDDRRQFMLNFDHKVLGDKLEIASEIMYTQTLNGGDTLAPSPLTSLNGNNLIVPANNPYNPFGTLLGVGQAAGSPTVRQRLIDVGPRTAANDTDTYMADFEVKGIVNDHLHWDTWADYSRSGWLTNVAGGANGANMNALMVPLISGGNYVKDPTTGRPLSAFVDPATGQQDLPVFDPFALPGYNDPRTINALKVTLFESGISELKNYHFIANGDILPLPAGDLIYSAGFEYLRQDLSYAVDGLYQNGLALGYGTASSFSGGTIATSAFFVELGAPLVSSAMHIPGVYDLDVTLAGRYEKLQSGPKSTVPKIGLKWQPLDDSLTFRATYSRGFISPTIFNLYGPSNASAQVFTVLQGNGQSGSGGALPGLPKVSGQFFTGSAEATQVSNPNLAPSKAETYTAGVVYSPKGLKGLDISLDYYHIKETQVGGIDWTGAVTNLNLLGSASPFASGFVFSDGSKLTSTAPNQVTSTNAGSLTIPLTLTGQQWTDGLDVDFDYTLPAMENLGVIKVGVNGTFLFNYMATANSGSPLLQYAGQFTTNSMAPDAQGNLARYLLKPYVDWSWNGLTADVDVNYVPTVTDEGTLFGDTTPGDTNAFTLNGAYYKIPSYLTLDVSLTYDFSTRWGMNPYLAPIVNNTSITVGAQDLTNKQPPFVPSGTEDNTDKETYSIIGRFVYVQISHKF